MTTVEFVGEIDENADFADLRRRLRGPVAFQLGEVRRINSCGVREWVNFVRDLPHVTDLSFSHCSPAIVTQLNMIYNFRGRAKIRSFYAPYVCDACGREEEQLIDAHAERDDEVDWEQLSLDRMNDQYTQADDTPLLEELDRADERPTPSSQADDTPLVPLHRSTYLLLNLLANYLDQAADACLAPLSSLLMSLFNHLVE